MRARVAGAGRRPSSALDRPRRSRHLEGSLRRAADREVEARCEGGPRRYASCRETSGRDLRGTARPSHELVEVERAPGARVRRAPAAAHGAAGSRARSVSWKATCTTGSRSPRGRTSARTSVPSECVVGTAGSRAPEASTSLARCARARPGVQRRRGRPGRARWACNRRSPAPRRPRPRRVRVPASAAEERRASSPCARSHAPSRRTRSRRPVTLPRAGMAQARPVRVVPERAKPREARAPARARRQHPRPLRRRAA